MNDLRAGRRVHARRYRNARLGEFFKELHLTEGRGTGLPIHDELQRNGSPEAIIDADDEHTYFMITIPCHPAFVCDKFTLDKDGHVLPVLKGDITENVTENSANVTENVTELSSADKRRQEMLQIIHKDPQITTDCGMYERNICPKSNLLGSYNRFPDKNVYLCIRNKLKQQRWKRLYITKMTLNR